ncbi:DMT family transporter [Propylenella binzhouense]|uniref:DMT family transporter n=1 Tax=Propylenella binzhouense TaxID=2555902 RepID=A0A964WW21_9HYPH|nr:DMT family transporter [Propylenella binzhouense]MYZ50420.1 DMT family transporter [Propylenella binzhouense]
MTASRPASPMGPTTAGMAMMIAAMLMAPGLDTIAKLLMERLSPAEAGMGRFLAQTLVLLPIVIVSGRMSRPSGLHALAGGFLGMALLCLNTGLRGMPVANALAIFFVEPLALTLLGAFVLGERVGVRRLSAIGVGLVGVLIVLRPNIAAYGLSAAWPLVAAVLFACYMLTSRILARRGERLVLQFWTGAFATIILAGALAFGVAAGPAPGLLLVPTLYEFALFAGAGVLASITHGLIVAALGRIEAGLVAPFQYLEIFSATLLGWLVFSDFPDPVTWTGTAVIVGAGIYVFHRERLQARSGPEVPVTG